MRYEKGHKDTTRQRIIDVAAKQFRENGVAAVGLAGIMSDAGLTNGAFYTHFESKEDLVQAVLGHALSRREATLLAASEANVGLEATIRDYLSPRHRDRPGGGCPTAALVAEVARHPKATRDAFTDKVSDLHPVDRLANPGRLGQRAAAQCGCDLRHDGGYASARARRQRQRAIRRNPGKRRHRRARFGRGPKLKLDASPESCPNN